MLLPAINLHLIEDFPTFDHKSIWGGGQCRSMRLARLAPTAAATCSAGRAFVAL